MSFGKTAEFVRKREIRIHKIGLIFEKASVQILCNSISVSIYLSNIAFIQSKVKGMCNVKLQ